MMAGASTAGASTAGAVRMSGAHFVEPLGDQVCIRVELEEQQRTMAGMTIVLVEDQKHQYALEGEIVSVGKDVSDAGTLKAGDYVCFNAWHGTDLKPLDAGRERILVMPVNRVIAKFDRRGWEDEVARMTREKVEVQEKAAKELERMREEVRHAQD